MTTTHAWILSIEINSPSVKQPKPGEFLLAYCLSMVSGPPGMNRQYTSPCCVQLPQGRMWSGGHITGSEHSYPLPILSSNNLVRLMESAQKLGRRSSSACELHGQVQIWTWESLVLSQFLGNYAMRTLTYLQLNPNIALLVQVPQGSPRRNSPSSPRRLPVHSRGGVQVALVDTNPMIPLELQMHVKVLRTINRLQQKSPFCIARRIKTSPL